MKAPSFAYVKPRSLAEAFELLGQPGAKALAGGQSLIPSLNMRLSAPQLLVDITGLAALKTITLEQGVVRIGALVTHAELGRSEDIRKHVPMLAQAVPHIAHPAIRNRGTLGGSIALADPAAEYPACLVALGASSWCRAATASASLRPRNSSRACSRSICSRASWSWPPRCARS